MKWLKPLIGWMSLFALWEVVVRLNIWPKYIFPSPKRVVTVWYSLLSDGELLPAVLVSLQRLAIGFAIAVVVGTLVGLGLARNKNLKQIFGGLILGLQTLPSICWLPLALLWFGLNETAILFVVLMGAVLSITVAVEGAVRTIPPTYVRVGKMFKLSRLNLYRRIILPAMLPNFVTGLKQGWAFAWRSLMAGEMLFITAGLGQLLMIGRELNNIAQVMAVMLTIVLLGLFIDVLIFGTVERRLHARWGFTKRT
ncbi:MAG TPA: sulfate ABC transporter permease [Candidatus Kerfeldbacteria bacterium]|nr:sulfate ABC transporter permease [Candidatus Kerfeldbacteria bacterium]